jgi:hypothetical protein
MNVSYKHLDSKLRIADLTIGQWLAVLAGVALAIVWGLYVSPFGATITMTSAIYLGAIPIGAAFLANVTEIDPLLLIRSAIAWRRLRGHFAPGSGDEARGYVVREERRDSGARRRRPGDEVGPLPAFLWEEQ